MVRLIPGDLAPPLAPPHARSSIGRVLDSKPNGRGFKSCRVFARLLVWSNGMTTDFESVEHGSIPCMSIEIVRTITLLNGMLS